MSNFCFLGMSPLPPRKNSVISPYFLLWFSVFLPFPYRPFFPPASLQLFNPSTTSVLSIHIHLFLHSSLSSLLFLPQLLPFFDFSPSIVSIPSFSFLFSLPSPPSFNSLHPSIVYFQLFFIYIFLLFPDPYPAYSSLFPFTFLLIRWKNSAVVT